MDPTPIGNGFTTTIGHPGDLDELVAVYRASEEVFEGRARIDRDWIDTQFREVGFEPERDVMTVRDAGGTAVAYAMVETRDPFVSSFCSQAILPGVLDAQVPDAIIDFTIARTTENVGIAPEGARIVASVGTHERDELMRRHLAERGFTVERSFLEMEIELDHDIVVPPIPDSVHLRTLAAGEPLDRLVVTVRDSFRDHFGFVDQPMDLRLQRWNEFRKAESWDDDLVFLAEVDDELVGVNVCLRRNGSDTDQGYVATLGVLPDHRGRGIARILLLACFAEYQRRGLSSVSLHVDAQSITGATRLYEGVGMERTQVHMDYELKIRDGEDMVRR